MPLRLREATSRSSAAIDQIATHIQGISALQRQSSKSISNPPNAGCTRQHTFTFKLVTTSGDTPLNLIQVSCWLETMAGFPPGITLIFANVPRMLLPIALTTSGIKLCKLLFSLSVPDWLYVPLSIASLPLALACRLVYADLRNKHQAKLHAAVLAPSVTTKWPGGLDLLISILKNLREGYMGEVFEQMCRAHGNTITFSLLWEMKLFTIEPEHIKTIVATQFSSFTKGPLHHEIFDSLLGIGIFNSDGDIWKLHRSMTRPFFTKERIGDFEMLEKFTEDALGQSKARLQEGYPIDFQDMVSRFTLDSATEFLFGKDVRSLSAGLVYPPKSPLATDMTSKTHPANVFAQAFLQAQIATSYRVRSGDSWRLGEFWGDRVKEHMKVCDKFIDPILKDALERKKSRKEAGSISENSKQVSKEETLLDHLVESTEDLKMIKDEILNVLIAGRDTTATAMACVVWMLSQHPEVLDKLRKEILSVVGNSRGPTLEQLGEMKYLKAVINETLRLYPPVPFNSRMSVAPVVLPAVRGGNPIYVPPNTRTPYSLFLMQRRKDLWGPDADEFDPNRFLDERLHKYLTPNPSIFMPFGVGPRSCMGQQFAYNEMSYFLTRLLQTFSSISLAEEVQTLAPAEWAKGSGRKAVEKVIIRSHLTAYIQDGLWVRMEEAGDAL